MAIPFDDKCPDCGHTFSLVVLKRMAQGDGWRRLIAIKNADGSRGHVSFDQFNPATMEVWPDAFLHARKRC